MLNSLQRDNRRRILSSKLELKRLQYKTVINNISLPLELRQFYREKHNRLPRNSSFTRIQNRCVLTGRVKGVLRFCKLSRIKFRELASKGNIVGVCKVSW